MHSNVKNDFLIPDLNRNYFSNDTYKFLFPEALSEDFIHSIDKLESQSIPTSKDDKSIKEEKKPLKTKNSSIQIKTKINKTDKKIDKFYKSLNQNKNENKFLTKKRSSSKNDIPIEQVKPNKSRFKENIIKGDKELKIGCNFSYIKQVILKCLECFNGFINIICNSKYNIQFSSINFEEMIPKDDESFQIF